MGIALMFGFCVVAPMGDAMAKVLGQSIPLGQLILARFALQALILIPIVFAAGRVWRMCGRILRLAFLRTLLHIGGIGTMFTALKYLPLADAVAIAFVMPFILLVLGRFVLNEEVGTRRMMACLVGFIGTLLVIQPSFYAIGWPALWPIAVAFIFAFFILVTRQLARDTDPIGLQAVSGVMATALLLPLVLAGDVMGWPLLTLVVPDTRDWVLLLAIGVLGTGAHLMMTWSLRFAPAATLAPMQYLEIPVATAIGWLIFRDLPNTMASVGICITIAAGLYVVLRERAMARQARKPSLQSPA
ncbi:EamA domain-containing membrane protein RarD [Sedimentitalea nanhaiensis]|uniref:EamA domain-containing membrane protein RarD n=1 Tax=Sedimentitalea nanhaiensis TaxID=999627 RepID=A0A1I7E198_9RHOB|nr:EamA domain-containing membrane protein RarD [Sedimentitalea nanhaiensis]